MPPGPFDAPSELRARAELRELVAQYGPSLTRGTVRLAGACRAVARVLMWMSSIVSLAQHVVVPTVVLLMASGDGDADAEDMV